MATSDAADWSNSPTSAIVLAMDFTGTAMKGMVYVLPTTALRSALHLAYIKGWRADREAACVNYERKFKYLRP